MVLSWGNQQIHDWKRRRAKDDRSNIMETIILDHVQTKMSDELSLEDRILLTMQRYVVQFCGLPEAK
jgi:hypothetical protein